jgi:hypothetical protein
MRSHRPPGARWLALLVAAVCSFAGPDAGRGQTAPPGGTTPGGEMLDRLREDTTRPIPRVPPRPATPPGPDMIWVPDRRVRLPGVAGSVLVPGHWEQRLSEHEVYVPPLTVRTEDGRTIQLPAGPRPPPDERSSP